MRSLNARKPFLSTIGGKVLIGLLVAALLPLDRQHPDLTAPDE